MPGHVGTELQLNVFYAVQKEDELAAAYSVIEELQAANRQLACELADRTSLPTYPTGQAVLDTTTPHTCQPTSTVVFGDEVLQTEVSKVCYVRFLA